MARSWRVSPPEGARHSFCSAILPSAIEGGSTVPVTFSLTAAMDEEGLAALRQLGRALLEVVDQGLDWGHRDGIVITRMRLSSSGR